MDNSVGSNYFMIGCGGGGHYITRNETSLEQLHISGFLIQNLAGIIVCSGRPPVWWKLESKPNHPCPTT
ncbi:hypothetical protein QQP08_009173 [Theobroma cacao]|nr:hypothetical protein QQP08_009173 [Theobroma cacao]